MSPEQREKELFAQTLVGIMIIDGNPGAGVARQVIKALAEAGDPPFASDEGGPARLLLGAARFNPAALSDVCEAIAEEIAGMEPKRREAWLGLMGDRAPGDESSTTVGERARSLMGDSYAWRERERLNEAARRAVASGRRAGL